MGIDGIQGKPDLKVDWQKAQRPATNKTPAAGGSTSEDDVSFSGQIQDLMRIRELVDAVPDIRQTRVDRLRQEVKLGTYNVSASDIADAIIRDQQKDLADL